MGVFSKDPFGIEGGPDLRHRIVYMVLLLLLFRLMAAIPVINVDEEQLHQLLADNPLVGIVDLFAGGEMLTHFSMAAAGIFPYLLALMLAHGATWAVPSLRELHRQGQRGQDRIDFHARVLTIPLAFLFAWALSQYLALQTGLFPGKLHWFTFETFWPSLKVVCLVTLGSLISTGITHLITKKGLGSGKNIVLLAGTSLGFVKQLLTIIRDSPSASIAVQKVGFAVVGGFVLIGLCVYLVRAVRLVPIQQARRPHSSGFRGSPPHSMHLPLLLNSGRILPVSAAMGLLTLVQFALVLFESHSAGGAGAHGSGAGGWLDPDKDLYWIVLAWLIVVFTTICNFSLIGQPLSGDHLSIADQLMRHATYIPGVPPGRQTQEYLSGIIARISLPAGLALAFLAAALPYAILRFTRYNCIVTVLSLMVVVIAIDGLRDQFRAYRLRESYEGSFHSSRKSG
jgi:preprotein translocase subunit SecY